MALLGGHRTQLKAPLKEVWKKPEEEERREKLEKMHDNKENTKQEQKIMVELKYMNKTMITEDNCDNC